MSFYITFEQLFGLTAFPAAMIVAALCDVLTLKIPNRLSLLVALGFVPAAYFAQLGWTGFAFHLLAGAIALGFGITAFALRWMGGGDGKFLAACALWFGPQDILSFAVAFSVVGGVVALLLLTLRRAPLPTLLARQGWIARLWDGSVGVPYALAFAAGGLFVYPQSGMWHRLMAG